MDILPPIEKPSEDIEDSPPVKRSKLGDYFHLQENIRLEKARKKEEERKREKQRMAEKYRKIDFDMVKRTEYIGRLRIDIMKTLYNECLSPDFFKKFHLVSLKHF